MRYITTFFVFMAIHLACLSQTGNRQQVQSENGTVFLIRSTGFAGSASSFSVFIDEILVCRVKTDSYSVHAIAPGMHKFAAQLSGKVQKSKAEVLDVKIEAGKRYFIQLTLEGGILTNKVYCQEITENSAQNLFKKVGEGGCK